MATRDLTLRFKQARSAAIRSRGGATGAAAGGGFDTSALVEAAPTYVDAVDSINEAISEIERKMTKLTGMHADRVKRTLGDSSELEMSIDALTRDITSQFGWAGRKLKTIASSSSTVEGKKSSDASIRVNIQRSLATKLQGMSGSFRKAQRRYLSEVNRRKDASSFDTLLGTSAGGASGAATADPDDVDTGMTDEQMEALANATASVSDRDEEIAHIARSIEELAEVFKELNVLVVDQGTLLDRIDHNVDMTLDTVKEGVKHLESAEKSQKSARPMWCIAALMVLIIIMIVIIAVRKA